MNISNEDKNSNQFIQVFIRGEDLNNFLKGAAASDGNLDRILNDFEASVVGSDDQGKLYLVRGLKKVSSVWFEANNQVICQTGGDSYHDGRRFVWGVDSKGKRVLFVGFLQQHSKSSEAKAYADLREKAQKIKDGDFADALEIHEAINASEKSS